jgi:maltose/maltodextrin transport system substrate-binding protein
MYSRPDHTNHKLYCYSAKEVGSVINAMVLYRLHFPGEKKALEIAEKAANYLIENSENAGKPLEYFPQVYEGEELSAARFSDEIIITEPSSTAMSYLSLYELNKNEKYFLAALNIANTYQKIQLENGSWFIRIKKDNGKPATQELCIPIQIVNFLEELIDNYGFVKYQFTVDRAIAWIWNNPMQTYNWSGQFEDVEAQKPHLNLTKYEASWFAQYLFKNEKNSHNSVSLATELLAFCEDQFIVLENPKIYDNWGTSSGNWKTPAVLEQYTCYVPIDASASQLIESYLSAYAAIQDKIYYEKAKALANSLVNAQEENGRIPTFWAYGFTEFWNNCMVSDLQMLNKLVKSTIE